MDRGEGRHGERRARAAPDHRRREGQPRPVGDRGRLVQEAKAEQGRDRDHQGTQPRALARDRQRLAGGRRDGARLRQALRLVATTMYDVIVAGLGAHGSSAAYHLAARGASVVGFDRFARGHTLGSSGGLSRIIRLSYYEHPDYVPLLRRAWALLRVLERASGE